MNFVLLNVLCLGRVPRMTYPFYGSAPEYATVFLRAEIVCLITHAKKNHNNIWEIPYEEQFLYAVLHNTCLMNGLTWCKESHSTRCSLKRDFTVICEVLTWNKDLLINCKCTMYKTNMIHDA